MLTYILFFIGFIFLIKGADLLIEEASALARRLGVSSLFIGLTIVAFGTSLPELVVNVFASFQGKADIAISNILGSNICNILLILGLGAIIYPLTLKKETVWKEIPFSFLAVILIALMANDVLIDGGSSSALTRIDGLVLICFFIIFLYYVFNIARVKTSQEVKKEDRSSSLISSSFKITLAFVGIFLGGRWIVDGAVTLASNLGVSQALIGATIVAFGTSLPELVTSIVAVCKKNVDLAVGNIVGSNIFNIFCILGLSAIIKSIPFSYFFNLDLLILMVATFLLFLFMFIKKKSVLERWQGIIFLSLYLFYIITLIVRG